MSHTFLWNPLNSDLYRFNTFSVCFDIKLCMMHCTTLLFQSLLSKKSDYFCDSLKKLRNWNFWKAENFKCPSDSAIDRNAVTVVASMTHFALTLGSNVRIIIEIPICHGQFTMVYFKSSVDHQFKLGRNTVTVTV